MPWKGILESRLFSLFLLSGNCDVCKVGLSGAFSHLDVPSYHKPKHWSRSSRDPEME